MKLGNHPCFSSDNQCEYKMQCLAAILELTSDIVTNTDEDGNIVYYNKSAEQFFRQYEDRNLRGVIQNWLHDEAIPKAMQDGTWQGEATFVDHTGDEIHLSKVVLANKWDQDQAKCFTTIIRDITKLKRAGEFEQLASDVLQNIIEGVVVTDASSHIISVNRAFTDVTGYVEAEVVGKKPNILSSGKHDRDFYENMWKDLLEKGLWKGEVWNRHKSGKLYLQKLTIKAIKNEQGETNYYVSLIEDITEKKQLEEQIQFQAFHDSLTLLPNRYSFNRFVEEAIQMASGEIALLLIDLVRFKRINDLFGHAAGDSLLLSVADRLVRNVGNQGTVFRLDGTQFVVIYPGYSEREAYHAAKGILDEFRRSFFIHDQDVMISINIGISLFPQDGSDVETLYKNADAALSEAKEIGSNNVQFFHNVTGQQNVELLTLEHSLYRALDEDQFELYFQPQLEVETSKINGYEVLVRWNHPERGMIHPMQFIPIAEDTGLIQALDEIVLRKACKQVIEWTRQGLTDLRASVNLSMKNFSRRDIVGRIQRILAETGVDPKQLIIELTESALMHNPDMAYHVLLAIKEEGVGIALDDFGTGYSSLAYLKSLPIDYLKIDRSFIRDITSDERSKALVISILHLASSLGLEVVAEGIETKEQLTLMQEHKCYEVQGYYISKPLPKREFEDLIKRWNHS